MAAIPSYQRVIDGIKNQWLSSSDVPPDTKLPTQEELAQLYRVSRTTVVRALSQLTAEGFVYSRQGSGVYISENLTPPSHRPCISLIVPELGPSVIVAVCRGVERRARQMDIPVLIASSECNIQREQELVEQHMQAGTKGILLYPATRNRNDLQTDYLRQVQTVAPLVAIDISCEEWRCSRVIFDNYRVGYEMTQLLIRHGHRRIAFMRMHPDRLHSSIHDREQGWRDAMREACLEIPRDHAPWPAPIHDFNYLLKESDFSAFAASVLAMRPIPDAVIAWTDSAAATLMHFFTNLGVRVPEDIRVTGFDNDPMVAKLTRPLFPTTVPNFARLGEVAVDVLKRTMVSGSQEPLTYYYSVPLLWRDCSGGTTYASQATNREPAFSEK